MVVGPAGDQVSVVHRELHILGVHCPFHDGGAVLIEQLLSDESGTLLLQKKM
jgi:hypothetical protein